MNKYKNHYLIAMRNLTPGMMKLLADIFRTEKNGLPPLKFHEQRHAKGLLVRGLITLKQAEIKGKTRDCITPTGLGKMYYHDNPEVALH
ncbi:MAG: hypothetical protein QM737_15885 [Ferruginibacter sp.]